MLRRHSHCRTPPEAAPAASFTPFHDKENLPDSTPPRRVISLRATSANRPRGRKKVANQHQQSSNQMSSHNKQLGIVQHKEIEPEIISLRRTNEALGKENDRLRLVNAQNTLELKRQEQRTIDAQRIENELQLVIEQLNMRHLAKIEQFSRFLAQSHQQKGPTASCTRCTFLQEEASMATDAAADVAHAAVTEAQLEIVTQKQLANQLQQKLAQVEAELWSQQECTGQLDRQLAIVQQNKTELSAQLREAEANTSVHESAARLAGESSSSTQLAELQTELVESLGKQGALRAQMSAMELQLTERQQSQTGQLQQRVALLER